MMNGNVFKLAQPGTFIDLLTEVLRDGARSLLVQAVEAEVADFLAKHADLNNGPVLELGQGVAPYRRLATRCWRTYGRANCVHAATVSDGLVRVMLPAR